MKRHWKAKGLTAIRCIVVAFLAAQLADSSASFAVVRPAEVDQNWTVGILDAILAAEPASYEKVSMTNVGLPKLGMKERGRKRLFFVPKGNSQFWMQYWTGQVPSKGLLLRFYNASATGRCQSSRDFRAVANLSSQNSAKNVERFKELIVSCPTLSDNENEALCIVWKIAVGLGSREEMVHLSRDNAVWRVTGTRRLVTS